MRRTTHTQLLAWVSGEELLGKKASLKDVETILRKIPRLTASRMITTLLVRLDPSRMEAWLALDRRVLRPTLLRLSLQEQVALADPSDPTRPRAVFHRQQLLAGLCLAQRFCPDSAAESLDTPFLLGDALLGISDILNVSAALSSEPPAGEIGALMLPYFYESNPPDPRFSLVRTSRLLTLDSWQSNSTLRTMSGRFQSDSGLSLQEYLFALVAMYAHLEVINQSGNLRSVPFRPPTHGSKTAAVRRAFEEMAVAYADLPGLVQEGPAVFRDRTFEPFRSRSLIRFPSDAYLFADYVLCAQQATSGLRWRLRQLAQSRGEAEALFQAWGTLTEEYLHALLKPVLHGIYIPNPVDSTGQEITDALIDYGDEVVVVECKAGLLRHDVKYANDAAALEGELQRKFVKERQLVGALERLFGRERLGTRFLSAMKGASPRGVRVVFPVLVAEDASLVAHGVARFIGDLVAREAGSASLGERPRIERVTVASMEDMESIVPILRLKKKLSNLLRERFAVDPQGDNTLHNHLCDIANRMRLDTLGDQAAFERVFLGAKEFWLQPPS